MAVTSHAQSMHGTFCSLTGRLSAARAGHVDDMLVGTMLTTMNRYTVTAEIWLHLFLTGLERYSITV